IKKGQIEVNLLEYSDPSPEADVNSEAYKNIRQSIWEAFPGAIVAPYMFIAADDARFYYPLTNNIFRFDPFVYNLEDQARIHGINERLHKDQLARGTQFFIRCLENTLIISK
ncbi:MAG: M20/M25/M40 family metallo-hydrolase, partial [Clostridia bacterium]|nr:M20/M25/M40 family metallo-hydrolase [Clostridia bacterium]